ncbi:hypothetical protein Q8A73_017093 [Channa argus]|nr:hypothetical protein Q8A73_017093 [Channa argus]
MESKSDSSTEVQLDEKFEFDFGMVNFECEIRFDELLSHVMHIGHPSLLCCVLLPYHHVTQQLWRERERAANCDIRYCGNTTNKHIKRHDKESSELQKEREDANLSDRAPPAARQKSMAESFQLQKYYPGS